MRIRTLISIAGVAVLLSSSHIYLGQDFQVRTKVDLVVVPVSVRDEGGRLVSNLTQDDFAVLEDGKLQTISNFSIDPQPMSVAIVVDTGITGGALRRFALVAKTLAPRFNDSDEIAVYRYDHFVKMLSDFSNKREDLERSFDAVKQIAESKPEDAGTGLALGPFPLRWILNRSQVGSNGAPPEANGPTGPARLTTDKPAPITRALHDAVFTAASDLEKRPNNRPKIVILISDGQAFGGNIHSETETAALLMRDGIQLYALGTDLKLFEHRTALNPYAQKSGGAVFDGGNEASMAASFGQLIEQARAHYVLGYISNNEARGPVLRKIEVKVGDGHFGVTHRRAYLQNP
jgi:VWFA-related protein